MPQEPKKKHSKARKRTRRASIMLKSLGLIKCSNCSQPTLPHQVCKNCGYYGKKHIGIKSSVRITKT